MIRFVKRLFWVADTVYTLFIIFCIQLVLNRGERAARRDQDWADRDIISPLCWAFATVIARQYNRAGLFSSDIPPGGP